MQRPIESDRHGGQRTTLVARSSDEAGMKGVEKQEVRTRDADTAKDVERKLGEKGLMRRDRQAVDGRGGVKRPPPKQGRGGRFTWEGPGGAVEAEAEALPGAVDENDPNYVDEEEEAAAEGGGGGAAVGKVVEGSGGATEQLRG
uniref:Uncharacterized protein n=1 Tax=Kalanchoe fedtschenkoi TaxID=63787 RepID=A0A7N0V566_KALFE